MRVLHIIPSLHPETGGPARSVPALCRALNAAGVETTLYTFRQPGAPITTDEKFDSYALHCFAPLAASRQWPTPAFFAALRAALRRTDLVHLHSLWNPVISGAAHACRQAQVPYVISPRGMLQTTALTRHQAAKTLYLKLCERKTIANAAAFHFLSDTEHRDSIQWLDEGIKTAIIPSGIDVSLAESVAKGSFRQRYPELGREPLVLFLGRLHWSKGLDLQFAAMTRVFEKHERCRWVLVGPDDGGAKALERQIRGKDLQDRVLITGLLPHRQCLEALADAEMLLMTSRHEAHSMAINEALAMGTPVVASDSIQMDQLQRWGGGISVPAQAETLANAVLALLNDDNRRRTIKHATLNVSSRRLDWESIALVMTQFYDTIVAAPEISMREGTTGV